MQIDYRKNLIKLKQNDEQFFAMLNYILEMIILVIK